MTKKKQNNLRTEQVRKIVFEIIQEHGSDSEKGLPYDDLFEMARKKGITPRRLENAVNVLFAKGLIYSAWFGYVKPV